MPNLLISVTGGAKNFNMMPRLKNIFRRGLVKVAQTTGNTCWWYIVPEGGQSIPGAALEESPVCVPGESARGFPMGDNVLGKELS